MFCFLQNFSVHQSNRTIYTELQINSPIFKKQACLPYFDCIYRLPMPWITGKNRALNYKEFVFDILVVIANEGLAVVDHRACCKKDYWIHNYLHNYSILKSKNFKKPWIANIFRVKVMYAVTLWLLCWMKITSNMLTCRFICLCALNFKPWCLFNGNFICFVWLRKQYRMVPTGFLSFPKQKDKLLTTERCRKWFINISHADLNEEKAEYRHVWSDHYTSGNNIFLQICHISWF